MNEEENVVQMDVDEVFGSDVDLNVDEAPEQETPVEEIPNEDAGKCFEVNPNMYVYFDMEFTGLVRDADLLSIGMCDNEGHSFYAEFRDFNFTKITPWLLENVMQKMVNPQTILEGDHWSMMGTSKEIRFNLLNWLNDLHERTNCGIQFVTDCGHYDMVFLIDLLWKDATRIPEWISPVACDINNDLANISYEYAIRQGNPDGEKVPFNPYHEAFNLNRDEYASHIQNAPQGLQHNAMYDAYVIRAIHQNIWQTAPSNE